MAVSPGNIIKVTARYNLSTVIKMNNVFHLQYSGVDAAADEDVQGDLAEWCDDMYTTIATLMSNVVVFDTIGFYNVTIDAPMGDQPWPLLTAGGNSSLAVASGLCALITGYTDVKRKLSRTFIGGLTINDLADYVNIGSAFIAALADFATLRVTPIVGVDPSRTYDHVVGSVLKGWMPINEIVVRSAIAYQRRRKLGVGE